MRAGRSRRSSPCLRQPYGDARACDRVGDQADESLRLRDRRRRLGGQRARQPPAAPIRPPRCSCWRRAGRTGRWTLFIHMPAALAFPIGNRFYDWKYESEPEPLMNGRRVYHARGKVLGGSSSINGMIFQRGNPMDYERWARDPGHGGLGLRALPAVLQADGDVPRGRTDDPYRGGTPARSCSSAARRRARCSGRSSRPSSRPATRSRTTSTATGRRASRPFDRNIHNGRRLSRGARLPAPGDGPPEPRRQDARVRRRGSCSRASARSASSTRKSAAGGEHGATPARSSCAAARSTRRSCCSSRASATRDELGALGIDVVHDLPGVGENLQDHLEVYVQYASQASRCRWRRRMKWRTGRRSALEWLLRQTGPGRDQPLRGRRLRAQQRATSSART